MSKFLREGLVAGAAGGLAMAVYLLLVVEPILAEAIALEEQGSDAHQALFTRGAQQLGGAVGTVLYGAFLGVLLGATVALVRHRLRGDDWQRAVRVAATAFVSALLVPFLKYPPNPPGVGDPSTVGRRTALYLLFVGISVIGAWSGWRLSRTLAARGLPPRPAVIAGATLYVVAMGVAGLLLPGSGNMVSLPAELVWRFRIASLGGTALLVAVTGVVLGWRLGQHPRAGVEEVGSRA
ncbi:MAG: CbtA family protein [Actinobacteria bacterium]|nr:CbtA family protein [Actinomycetota bacterium]MBW3651792.1 CbtA family protein [Actinomycetota bacterium]